MSPENRTHLNKQKHVMAVRYGLIGLILGIFSEIISKIYLESFFFRNLRLHSKIKPISVNQKVPFKTKNKIVKFNNKRMNKHIHVCSNCETSFLTIHLQYFAFGSPGNPFTFCSPLYQILKLCIKF